ncbi:MAG: hypothetical protein L6R40_008816 [Gallowayella cf. fulva]|nr:MAG: hypothetical protein L6R40_008816 [Xanthomendoza cf. fulva]
MDEGMLIPGSTEGEAVPSVTLEEQSIPDHELPVAEDEVVVGDGTSGQSGIVEGEEMEGVDSTNMAIQQAGVEVEKTAVAAEDPVKDVPDALQTDKNSDSRTIIDGPLPSYDPGQPDGPEAPDPTALTNQKSALNEIQRSIERERDPEAPSEHTSNSGKGSTNTPTVPSHSMTTRARARSPQTPPSPSPTPSDSASIPTIHPWFLAPETSLPDRDLGLPVQEAEETRRLLLLYVQKQEHVVRQLQTLYNGLQRADRLRREVYRASKAEAHLKDDGKGNVVTEMSDGEDWYDVEDWGLGKGELKVQKDGLLGLEKGKDEVEDAEEEGRRGGRRRRVNRM